MKVLLALASWLAVLCFGDAAWVQKHIVTSFWVDPPATLADVYMDIAAANFTTVLGGFGATTPSLMTQQIQACSDAGLELLANPAGLPPSKLPFEGPVIGYQIKDEPSTKDFPSLRNTTAAIAEVHPDALSFINLLPTYATPAQLGAPTYEAYVQDYIAQVQPQFLCVDHYPRMTATSDSREAYTANLAILRNAGAPHNLAFWVFFQAMPYNNHPDVTEAQLRWQAMAALASGARGLLYFCLWTPPGFGYGGAIYTPKALPGASAPYHQVRGVHWYHARDINSIAKAWSPTLMEYTVSDTYRVFSNDTNPPSVLSGGPVTNVTAGVNLFIGGFKSKSSSASLALIVNWDTGFPAWPTVTFCAAAGSVKEVDKSTGAVSEVLDDSPNMPGLQLRFSPGDGRLFMVQC